MLKPLRPSFTTCKPEIHTASIECGANPRPRSADPASPNYGKHLSKAEVVKLFAADDKTIASVKRWLVDSGVSEKAISVSPTKNWIRVNAPAETLNKAIKARYHVYRSNESGDDHFGVDEYSLPNELVDLVDYVRPAIAMTKVNRRAAKSKAPISIYENIGKLTPEQASEVAAAVKALPYPDGSYDGKDLPPALKMCNQIITPACIAYLYKIPKATQSNVTNSMGIFETIGDVYSQEDLDLFFKSAAPWIPQGTGPNLDLINGATAPNPPETAGGESNLDFDMAYPIVYPQTTTLFQVDSQDFSDAFGDWLAAIDSDYCPIDPYWNNHDMCGTYDPTNVFSISYGSYEDPEFLADSKRQCTEFMKLGLMGITVVVASGDAGVTDRKGLCFGPYHNIFVPDDLCSCPYITGVGSTILKAIDQPEVATDRFSSGGGFSNNFLRPSWQDDAVGNYLLRHNPGYKAYNTSDGKIPPNSGIYNRGGRGFPDVAALGDNGLVASNGELVLYGGTSMSAPIVAAIFNRINEKRLSVGKGPIGFANPALYALSKKKGSFQDVTVGDQRLGGIGSDRRYSSCGNNGFSCVPGWDPVTGLGTPNYQVWESYLLSL